MERSGAHHSNPQGARTFEGWAGHGGEGSAADDIAQGVPPVALVIPIRPPTCPSVEDCRTAGVARWSRLLHRTQPAPWPRSHGGACLSLRCVERLSWMAGSG